MRMFLFSLAALVVGSQMSPMDQHATIVVGPGLQVMRAGQVLEASGAIPVVYGDTLSVTGTEKFNLICPDNSIITLRPGSTLRVDRYMGHPEYSFKKGSFHVYSCAHAAPPGHPDISIKTCCIRIWYPEQYDDTNFDVTVVGSRHCQIKHQSGMFFQQEHVGGRNIGKPMRTGS